MRIRIYYMAELERETQKEAEEDVIMNPNLLQYLYTMIYPDDEELEGGKITGYKVSPKKDFNTFIDIHRLDKDKFDGIDDNTIDLVYHNRYTNGMVFTAKSMENNYAFVFYIPHGEEVQVVMVLSTPDADISPEIIGKFIAKDLEKSRAFDISRA